MNKSHQMHLLLSELFPICRSITGKGVQQTLDIIKSTIPLTFHSYPSGMKCFDWEIPFEWNITSASIIDQLGNKVVDFHDNNLHIVGYSEPVSGWFSFSELKKHIYTIPDRPDAIPYMTSYYQRHWGFCMTHNDFLKMQDCNYHVEINSSLVPGNLVVAEAFLPGKVDKEILLSCYCCHPSMANDSLSGVVLVSQLYTELAKLDRYYGYRFLFCPETIGTIAYLSQHGDTIKDRLHAGLVVTCVGDPGMFNYKQSRNGHTTLDRVTENILKFSGFTYRVRPFWPQGSDERQYCSPGFDLPVGSLMRSVYGEFPQYHTSDDNLEFVTEHALDESLNVYLQILRSLQGNIVYQRINPYCEPFMSKYGLYKPRGAESIKDEEIQRRMWILNYSDGCHALIDIAEKSNMSILNLIETATGLENAGIILKVI